MVASVFISINHVIVNMKRWCGKSRIIKFNHSIKDHSSPFPVYCDSVITKEYQGVIKIIRTNKGKATKYERRSTVIFPADKYSSLDDIYHILSAGRQELILKNIKLVDKFCVNDKNKEYIFCDVIETIERSNPKIKKIFIDQKIRYYPEILDIVGLEVYVTEEWGDKELIIKQFLEQHGKLETIDDFSHKSREIRSTFRLLVIRHAVFLFAESCKNTDLSRTIKSNILGPLDLVLTDAIFNAQLVTDKRFEKLSRITRKEIVRTRRLKELMTEKKIKNINRGIEELSKELKIANKSVRRSCTSMFKKFEFTIIDLLDEKHKEHATYISEQIIKRLNVLQKAYKCFKCE
ncbi:MAG: hypothetical protein EPO37_02170 [Nitrosarchaeum sp.]|nr:MAG: hypothetical protein EPO37_02170 [Nitrosarchaeum sp.]